MASEYFKPDSDGEVIRPSYPDLEPAQRPHTMISHGLPYEQACKKHVDSFLNASRVYIIASKSLPEQTQCLAKLEATLGEKHAATWIGVKPHSPYDDLVEILQDVKAKKVDCLVTLGGGSLADGAKLIVYALENGVGDQAFGAFHQDDGGKRSQAPATRPVSHWYSYPRHFLEPSIPSTLAARTHAIT